MLGTIIGTLVDIDRRSSGALSLRVRDAAGEATVYAHAEIGLDRALVERGDRVRATGIVGQRASRTGSPDGHRLWLRGRADIDATPPAPGATPPPDGEPGDQPGDVLPPRVQIKDATPGRIVTIVGVVTSKAGLIDGEGRRVTVQDRSGAILVRYPADVRPAPVGRVIRASGSVGTWFGATQLEATTKPRHKGRAAVVPMKLARAPQPPDEWRLVTVRGEITDIERSGDTWRAEAAITGDTSVPIVGLAGSHIDAALLEPGRLVTLTGIIRPAYPTASDQRLGIAPRSRKDMRLGRLRDAGSGTGDRAGGDGGEGADRGEGPIAGVGTAPVVATLAALSELDGSIVRIGGRLERISGQHLTLDDGTARARVRLADAVESIEPALRVGEVLNVTGQVRRRSRGMHEVLVGSASDVRRAVAMVHPTARQDDGRLVPLAGSAAIPTVGPSTAEPEMAATSGTPSPVVLVLLVGTVVAGVLALAAAAFLAWRTRPAPGAAEGPVDSGEATRQAGA